MVVKAYCQAYSGYNVAGATLIMGRALIRTELGFILPKEKIFQ